MKLDDRSILILQEISALSRVRPEYLSVKYGLSRDQVNYSFKKINDWLEDNNLPTISKDHNGLYKCESRYQELFIKDDREEKPHYIHSAEERAQLLCFILLCKTEDLTLYHLTLELQVSKNTVLADLNQARTIASAFSLQISHNRMEGYYIEGKEWNKRLLLMALVETIQKRINGSQLLKVYGRFTDEEIIKMNAVITSCEINLQIRFTDEKHDALPYLFVCIIRRVERDLTLEKGFIDLSSEKAYNLIAEMIEIESEKAREELSFLALQILTANLSYSFETEEKMEQVVIRGLRQMVERFEQISCTVLLDREELVKKLILHLRPAYYRIKYGLTTNMFMDESAFLQVFNDELKDLHHLVCKSIIPLEISLGRSIPDKECRYLTMLIGGWMEMKGKSLQHRIKALVVCPNGVSVSKLMRSSLNQLFPEFVFMDALSVREFREYNLDYDVLFSPVYLETDKKLFVIKPIIDNKEKELLRKQVMHAIYGFTSSSFDVEDILKIISKHADIHNAKALKREISHYIKGSNRVDTDGLESEGKPDLAALIPLEHIVITSKINSWREAIEAASQPLLKNGYITKDYIEKMILLHDVEQPYIVYGSDIALPHATPEDGVNKLSMSLLKIDQGVKLSKTQTIRLVIVLAPIDKNRHLRALIQLSELSESPEIIEKIAKAQTAEEVHICLKSLTKENTLSIS